MTARMREENFDFTKQVVLSTPVGEPLVAARNMRLSLIRGRLHVSGTSEGTSLVVLRSNSRIVCELAIAVFASCAPI
jgi:hypothetical protein